MAKIGSAYLYDKDYNKLQNVEKPRCLTLFDKYLTMDKFTPKFMPILKKELNKTFGTKKTCNPKLSKILANSSYEDIIKYITFNKEKQGIYSLQIKGSIMLYICLDVSKDNLEKYLTNKGNFKKESKVVKEGVFEAFKRTTQFIEDNYNLHKSGSGFNVSYYAPDNSDEEVIEFYGPGQNGAEDDEIIMYIFGGGDCYKNSVKMIAEIQKEKDLNKYLKSNKKENNLQQLNWAKMKKRLIEAGWEYSGPFGDDVVDYDNGTYKVHLDSQSGTMDISVDTQGRVHYAHNWDECKPQKFAKIFNNADECLKWADKNGFLYVP